MKKFESKLIQRVLAGFIAVALTVTAIPMAYQKVHAESNVTNIASGATIDAETPGWVPDWMKYPMLVNGSATDGCYYTSLYATAKNTTKTITFSYGQRETYVEKMILYPYTYGFPEAFHIDVWNGKGWVTAANSTGNTNVTGSVEVVVNQTCSAIRLVTDILGPSNSTSEPYTLQLTEIEIMGAYGNGTLLPADSQLVNYGDNIAPSATEIVAETVGWAGWMGPGNLNDGNTNGYDPGPGNYGLCYTSEYEVAAATEKTIVFQFDKDYRMDGVMLYPRKQDSNNGFPKAFKVEVMDSQGTVVGTTTGNATPDANGCVSDAKIVNFASPVAGRSLKITATELGPADNGGKYALQLAEVAIFGTANVAPSATIEAEIPSWAPGWMHPSYLNNGNAYDTGSYTSWYVDAAATEKTIEFQFGSDYNMNGLALYPRWERAYNNYNGYPAAFKVEIYDGTQWTQVATGGTAADENGCVNKMEVVSFEATCGSRLRITATTLGNTDSATQYGLQLAEVDIFGTEAPATEVYYNLDEKGDYFVGSGKTLTKDGKIYKDWAFVNVSGDYTSPIVVGQKAVMQNVYLWKSGDTHPDSNLDSRDLVAMKKAVAGTFPATKSGQRACDMNGDGKTADDDCSSLRTKVLTDWRPFGNLKGVAFGTSLTARGVYNSPDPGSENYFGYLRELQKLSGIHFMNEAIGGTCLLSTDTDWNSIYNRVRFYEGYADKDVAIIEGAYNDWRENKPLGAATDTEPTTVSGCLRASIQHIKNQNPNIKIFVLLDQHGQDDVTNPTEYTGRTDAVNKSNLTQAQYYSVLKDVCTAEGVTVIDMYELTKIDEKTPDYLYDFIHLNAAGEAYCGGEVYKAMLPYLKELNK